MFECQMEFRNEFSSAFPFENTLTDFRQEYEKYIRDHRTEISMGRTILLFCLPTITLFWICMRNLQNWRFKTKTKTKNKNKYLNMKVVLIYNSHFHPTKWLHFHEKKSLFKFHPLTERRWVRQSLLLIKNYCKIEIFKLMVRREERLEQGKSFCIKDGSLFW